MQLLHGGALEAHFKESTSKVNAMNTVANAIYVAIIAGERHGIFVNSVLSTGISVHTFPDSTSLLRFIPIGAQIHNIELYSGSGG